MTQIQIPTEGHFFDRTDEDGHTRTYYANGREMLYLQALADTERPGRWLVMVRWARLGKSAKWLQSGWGPLDCEKDAMALMDAVGIGYEAASGGATCLGHLKELVPGAAVAVTEMAPKVGRTPAVMACRAAGWVSGTVLKAPAWAYQKTIRSIDERAGEIVLYCQDNNSTQRTRTLPTDVVAS